MYYQKAFYKYGYRNDHFTVRERREILIDLLRAKQWVKAGSNIGH